MSTSTTSTAGGDAATPASRTAPVPARADYPAIEARILERWARQGAFEASVEQHPVEGEYVFYDGPPFANGLPHYGHLLTSYVKDVVPRYRTMRGRRVERRFGWDCHGLPAEMEVEKEIGVAGRKAIIDFGIERFNAACRSSVMTYTQEWEDYVTRMARWVDFDDDYKTMDLPYMESVLWAFHQLWEKGWVYEAKRVMPYSWGAQTPLSNFEIRLDDATRPRQDPAITVALRLRDPVPGLADDHAGLPAHALVWTTTPWTLPSNQAAAVGPDIAYAVVRVSEGPAGAGEALVLLGADRVEAYAAQLGGDHEVVATVHGRDLAGLRYVPVFDFFADHDPEHDHRVLVADFVDTSEGTGIVHMAPGFGEDDQAVCEANDIELVVPVDDAGAFTDEVPPYAGMNVFDANAVIIRDLKAAGTLVRHDSYEHNYPHCWRTDTPIIYRAIPSWYVEVTAFRDRMVELNEQINWIPDHVQGGAFGRWIANARDWSISRNRFWGAPIPVWTCGGCDRRDVYGSIAQLEADFGVEVTDLHRPFVDQLTRPCPDCAEHGADGILTRVPEVLDCWFESGSMPFAQVHYPFEGDEGNARFEATFPADFIVEYIGQTRGWFYTLHVLATALFDRPAFENVICHGIVLDEEGRKLSKRLRNYPDPLEVFASHGADAMRWFLVSSPVLRGENLRVNQDASQITEVVRQVLNPIWSAFYFYTLYADADDAVGHPLDRQRAEALEDPLDRYVLAKLRVLVEEVTEALDAYLLSDAAASVLTFVDALNNWYIRRSRDRFWAGAADASAHKQDAYDTLFTVLVTLSKVLAPLLPFLAEEIHTTLVGGADDVSGSVHLQAWPDADDLPADEALVRDMDRVRDVVTAALGLREDAALRNRLPLRSLTVAALWADDLRPFTRLVADEVNVKQVELSTEVGALAAFSIWPNGRVLGPRLGRAMQQVMGKARSGDWEAVDEAMTAVRMTIDGEEVVLRRDADEFEVRLEPAADVDAAVAALPRTAGAVALDTHVDDELRAEGRARDLVRAVQQARRDAGLHVSDRIALTVWADDDLLAQITPHLGWLGDAVLADDLSVRAQDPSTAPDDATTADLDGLSASFALARA